MDSNQNNYNEQPEMNGQPAYQAYMEVKSKSRGFAVASLVLGILSVVCCCFLYVTLAMAILSIIFAIVSRRKMGYFDPLALAGLILGIIGAVFGVANIAFEVMVRMGMFDELLQEYEKMFEDIYGTFPPEGEI